MVRVSRGAPGSQNAGDAEGRVIGKKKVLRNMSIGDEYAIRTDHYTAPRNRVERERGRTENIYKSRAKERRGRSKVFLGNFWVGRGGRTRFDDRYSLLARILLLRGSGGLNFGWKDFYFRERRSRRGYGTLLY